LSCHCQNKGVRTRVFKLFNLIIYQVPQSLNIALCDVCVGKSERKIKQFS
jgi:hypothetical protein